MMIARPAEAATSAKLIAAVLTAPGAPYGAMVNVLDELRSAGASRITLGVPDPDPRRLSER